MADPLRAYFINRSKARTAGSRLRAVLPGCATHVDIAGDVYALTVTDADLARHAEAIALIRDAGGRIEDRRAAKAPRVPQPAH
ncbi:MAG: hypothetical protein DI556_06460 [Rhodovulum sulfidophilum]|uniref:Uncharacterized protein n=1 Tax=Rhodovulum sulfidophilum TaxID=35806 RepID=A0A2W5NIW0_RHOSU|nr:MAG: hypothetical protein DI556_06460 [Rhodovulum sulfidophilum]